MGKVIICASQKGGVGKTSTATALASIFAQRGYRTLIIDCDQQCNTTNTYRAETEGVATIYDVLLDESRISISEAIQHTECGEILAGDSLLRQADEKLKGCVDGLYRMADALENRNLYRQIKSMDKNELSRTLNNIYEMGKEDALKGIEAVDIDMDRLRSQIGAITGIGETRLNLIMEIISEHLNIHKEE